ncbi:MAG: TIGR00725 family protein [Chloroflexi bacterium]|nr:TIGR00725 family protein [Chloroflexota bacterium]
MMVAVVGGGDCSAEEAEIAEAVGWGLARRKVVLICGGLDGVMEAACRGAKSAGGVTVGVLPGDSHHAANPYVDIPIVTGMGHARNVIVVKSAQAVIAVGGGYGTLSEIAHALRSNIPVVGIGTWSLSRSSQQDWSVILARCPEDAVEEAVAAAESRGERI